MALAIKISTYIHVTQLRGEKTEQQQFTPTTCTLLKLEALEDYF